ncbi:MAG: DUF4405 domain-containing protein [Ardenticatenaceae bacterium]|nr:DUF4405 domain-containing protein [Ardenticatenaceae bacterium]MCB8950045.1 DUF4405 domain-containing protein [Ardenticatenaceae bacterium]
MTTLKTRKKIGETARNLFVDLVIAVGFLFSLQPHFTGMTIHEWLGISLAGAFLLHILLHWRWLYATTSRFFKKLARQSRVNFILNLVLLIDFTLITLTGILISEEVLPLLGLTGSHSMIWKSIHTISAELSIWIVGLHIALHWKWVLSATKKYLFGWLPRRKKQVTAQANSII